ncbi:MAG: hypothetical protein ACAH95_04565 [Fimbriimonas sp.]
MGSVFAAADIGSNTAHVLVADYDGRNLITLANENEWIALGETVSRTGHIPDRQQQLLVSTIARFKTLATQRGARSMYVFATEAMRVADNHEQVKDRIWDATKVEIDIIEPAREAELSLIGTSLDTYLKDVQMLFEVGGGSAQIAQVSGSKIGQEVSLPLGTGRLIVKAALRNPCPVSAWLAAEDTIDETLRSSDLDLPAKVAVASGGVVRGLWRALHPDGEKTLSLEELDYIAWAAGHLPIDAIMRRFSVKQKRGSTLLPGALVYRALLRRHNVQELRISEYGIREGAVLQMANRLVTGSPF